MGWFNLLWRQITNSAYEQADFGWINDNNKFLLKLLQIEITSTLPLVGWIWISISTLSIGIWYYYLSTLIPPQKAELIVILLLNIEFIVIYDISLIFVFIPCICLIYRHLQLPSRNYNFIDSSLADWSQNFLQTFLMSSSSYRFNCLFISSPLCGWQE